MREETDRIEWIDIARGIGLVLVILGHLRLPYMTTWLYTFHMPLFFFLSGCVYRQIDSYRAFLYKKAKSLVIPYWCLGLIIWLFYVLVNMYLGHPNTLYGDWFSMLINMIKQQGFWTIWFLACLFVCQILFYANNLMAKDNNKLLIIISILQCTIAFVYYRLNGTVLPWCLDIALVAQLFFALGYIFNKSKVIKKFMLKGKGAKWATLCLSLLAGNCLTGYINIRISGESLDMSIGMYGNEFLSSISALFGILFLIAFASRIHLKSLLYLGRNTMIIFAWHSRIIIVVLEYIYKKYNLFSNQAIFQMLRCIVSLIIILAILIPITELVKKTKARYLFGV